MKVYRAMSTMTNALFVAVTTFTVALRYYDLGTTTGMIVNLIFITVLFITARYDLKERKQDWIKRFGN